MESRRKRVEDHENQLQTLRVQDAEEYNMVKIKLETDVQVGFLCLPFKSPSQWMFMFLHKMEVLGTLYPIGLILGGSQQFISLKLNLAVHSSLSFPFKYYVGTLVK